jgi:hypothetical protein
MATNATSAIRSWTPDRMLASTATPLNPAARPIVTNAHLRVTAFLPDLRACRNPRPRDRHPSPCTGLERADDRLDKAAATRPDAP